jgi:hypothetical protein
VPAIPPCIQEPRWDQVTALMQSSQVHHPLGCHRQRIPDRVVFDKLIQLLVFGCGYRRIADHTCSATTLRRRRDEWIALGAADRLHRLTLAVHDRLHGLDLEHLRWTAASPRPCGGQVAGPSAVTLRRGPDRWRARAACPVLGQARTWSLRGEGLAEHGRSAWSPTAQPHWRSGWTLSPWTAGHPLGPLPRADTLADGRRGRPYGRTGSFVIRAPRPTRTDGRLQTTRGTRVRPCGRPRRPSALVSTRAVQHASKCPSWTAVRTAVRAGVRPSVRERPSPDRRSCLEGAGEQDERALAIGEAALGPDHPDVATWRGNLGGVLQALQEATSEGPASAL